MIDSQELQAIRGRYAIAEKAVAAALPHEDDGLFGELPPEEAPPLLDSAVASARDVPRLADEVERLSPAEYWVGPEECMERQCDGYVDEDGNQVRDFSEPCEHVEVKVATLADVKRAEHLDELAEELRKAALAYPRGKEWAAGRGMPEVEHVLDAAHGDPADLAEIVLQAINDTYARIYCDEDINPSASAAEVAEQFTAQLTNEEIK